jgi:hypothetical protein
MPIITKVKMLENLIGVIFETESWQYSKYLNNYIIIMNIMVAKGKNGINNKK